MPYQYESKHIREAVWVGSKARMSASQEPKKSCLNINTPLCIALYGSNEGGFCSDRMTGSTIIGYISTVGELVLQLVGYQIIGRKIYSKFVALN